MMEVPSEEHRNSREGLVKIPGTQVRGECHLREVILYIPHHAPHGQDDGIDLNMLELQVVRLDASILQGLGNSIRTDGRFQGMHWHDL